jgi:hypothetical protein
MMIVSSLSTSRGSFLEAELPALEVGVAIAALLEFSLMEIILLRHHRPILVAVQPTTMMRRPVVRALPGRHML